MTTVLEVAIARVEERQRAHEVVCEERQEAIKTSLDTVNTRITSLRSDLRADRKADMDALSASLKEGRAGFHRLVYGTLTAVLALSIGINGWLIARTVMKGML
jgi:hypothetical protein